MSKRDGDIAQIFLADAVLLFVIALMMLVVMFGG